MDKETKVYAVALEDNRLLSNVVEKSAALSEIVPPLKTGR